MRPTSGVNAKNSRQRRSDDPPSTNCAERLVDAECSVTFDPAFINLCNAVKLMRRTMER